MTILRMPSTTGESHWHNQLQAESATTTDIDFILTPTVGNHHDAQCTASMHVRMFSMSHTNNLLVDKGSVRLPKASSVEELCFGTRSFSKVQWDMVVWEMSSRTIRNLSI